MLLAWPATSWVYWCGVALVTAGLLCIIRRRRARGLNTGRAGVALVGFLAAAAAVAVLPGVLVPQSPWGAPAPATTLWAGTAVVLAAMGLVVGAWAVAGDPARGRRRCPKCWYDMNGIAAGERGGFTCPECGRTARTERRLMRTRRSRRQVGLAAAMLAASLACVAVPPALDGTWVRYPPNTVYVLTMPWLGTHQRAAEEFSKRFGGSGVPPAWQTGWRARLLRARALAAMDPGNSATVIRLGLRTLVFMDDKPVDLVGHLLPLTRHADQYVRWNALDVLVRVPADRRRTLDLLTAALDDPTSPNRLAAADVLGAFGAAQRPRIDGPASLLKAAASDPDLKVRRAALWSLAGFNPTPASLDLLARALDDPDIVVRRNALCTLDAIEPDLHRLHAVLIRMMNDPEPWIRTNALQMIARRGPYTDQTADAFIGMAGLVTGQPGNVADAFKNLAESHAPSDWLHPVLLRAAENPYLCHHAFDALMMMGARARPLLPAVCDLRDRWESAPAPAPCLKRLVRTIEAIEAAP